MGSFLDKPETTHHTLPEDGGDGASANNIVAAMSCMQGWRVEMEDDHTLKISLSEEGYPNYSFFAVFDGHGGKMVANKSAKRLLANIVESSEWRQPHSVENLQGAIRRGFFAMDEELRQSPEAQNNEDHSGSTAVCALVTPTHIIFGNCGDSRGILVSHDAAGAATVRIETKDHKPNNPEELKRIQDSGNHVSMKRVNGDLAVSRALGDFSYKNYERDDKSRMPPETQAVSCEPELFVVPRQETDSFLVLACDGIWDVFESQAVGEILTKWTSDGARSPMQLSGELIDEGLRRNSRDNMSALVAILPGAPKPPAGKVWHSGASEPAPGSSGGGGGGESAAEKPAESAEVPPPAPEGGAAPAAPQQG